MMLIFNIAICRNKFRIHVDLCIARMWELSFYKIVILNFTRKKNNLIMFNLVAVIFINTLKIFEALGLFILLIKNEFC